MIDLIQNKKAALLAQRGQLEQNINALDAQKNQTVANLNGTFGAIMACDELIAEILAEQSKAAAAAIAAEMVPEAVVTIDDEPECKSRSTRTIRKSST